jgi:hypothetical protein
MPYALCPMPYALCPMPYALYQACTALLLRKAISVSIRVGLSLVIRHLQKSLS